MKKLLNKLLDFILSHIVSVVFIGILLMFTGLALVQWYEILSFVLVIIGLAICLSMLRLLIQTFALHDTSETPQEDNDNDN